MADKAGVVIEWAVREDGEDHVVISRFVSDDNSRVWKDVARVTGEYTRMSAEDIARAMNEAEARHEARRNT